jgi:hypothetical protein
MLYEIAEISTAVESGMTYVLARYWLSKANRDAGQLPHITEEFQMQISPTGRRIVTDGRGWLKRADGVFVDPATLDPAKPEPEWTRETYILDVPALIRTNVENYWRNVAVPQKLSGDHTTDATKPLYRDGTLVPQRPSLLIARDNSDPKRVLERADVKALRGAVIEATDVAAIE